MARDYKNAGSKPSKRPANRSGSKADKGKPRPAATASKPKVEGGSRQGMSPTLSMAIGLGIGLAIAVYVYFMLKPKATEVTQVPVVVVEQPAAVPKDQATEAVEEKGSSFDFYSILPKLEVVIPDQEIYQQTDEAGEKSKIKAIKQPGRYLLQAGSFKKVAEAERVRAELALLGIESHIENVTINNSDTWHRVRIGPFDDNKKLDKVRNRLLDNGVDVMVLKVKS